MEKCSIRYVLIEDCSTLIQTSPQISMRRVGLSQERLSGLRLMCPLNNGMIGWAADAA
jgi:hypothetical protein